MIKVQTLSIFSSCEEQLYSQWGSLTGTFMGTQTQSRLIYVPLLKMLEKWSVPWTTPESTWLFLLCFIFIKTRPDQNWSIAAICKSELPNPRFLVLTEFKSTFMTLWVMNCFFILQTLSQKWNLAILSLLIHYFHGRCLDELQTFVPLV